MPCNHDGLTAKTDGSEPFCPTCEDGEIIGCTSYFEADGTLVILKNAKTHRQVPNNNSPFFMVIDANDEEVIISGDMMWESKVKKEFIKIV